MNCYLLFLMMTACWQVAIACQGRHIPIFICVIFLIRRFNLFVTIYIRVTAVRIWTEKKQRHKGAKKQNQFGLFININLATLLQFTLFTNQTRLDKYLVKLLSQKIMTEIQIHHRSSSTLNTKCCQFDTRDSIAKKIKPNKSTVNNCQHFSNSRTWLKRVVNIDLNYSKYQVNKQASKQTNKQSSSDKLTSINAMQMGGKKYKHWTK